MVRLLTPHGTSRIETIIILRSKNMAQSPSERIVRRGRVFPEIQWTEEQKAQDRARRKAFSDRCWAIFERLKPEILTGEVQFRIQP
jgi:hypothetical protein